MSAQHTEGPWRVVGREPTRENVRFGHWDVEGKSNVASSCTYHDARLIAAAPELLEAVQRARRHAENIGITDGSYVAQLDAALAKALPVTSREMDRG